MKNGHLSGWYFLIAPILFFTLVLFSCGNKTPNIDKYEIVGQAFDAGESPAFNVYDVEHHGYRIWVIKEIHNPNEREQWVGAILDPRYSQKPMYEVTHSIKIDTLQDLSEPININLKD